MCGVLVHVNRKLHLLVGLGELEHQVWVTGLALLDGLIETHLSGVWAQRHALLEGNEPQ